MLTVVLVEPSTFTLLVVVSVRVTFASPEMMAYWLVDVLVYVLPKMSFPVVVELLVAPIRFPA